MAMIFHKAMIFFGDETSSLQREPSFRERSHMAPAIEGKGGGGPKKMLIQILGAGVY